MRFICLVFKHFPGLGLGLGTECQKQLRYFDNEGAKSDENKKFQLFDEEKTYNLITFYVNFIKRNPSTGINI